jgi:hypothetical protein
MAFSHNHSSIPQQQSMGQKVVGYVKTGAEVAGALKGIWDASRMIYGVARVAAPMALALL